MEDEVQSLRQALLAEENTFYGTIELEDDSNHQTTIPVVETSQVKAREACGWLSFWRRNKYSEQSLAQPNVSQVNQPETLSALAEPSA